MQECFGQVISADKVERNHRFLEEALELAQACGGAREECLQLVDYVYDRPVGEPSQEVGGVMVTLAALCLAAGMDMHQAGEVELARIWTKVEQIRAKQASKPRNSPLPQTPLAQAAKAQTRTQAAGVDGEAVKAALRNAASDMFIFRVYLLSVQQAFDAVRPFLSPLPVVEGDAIPSQAEGGLLPCPFCLKTDTLVFHHTNYPGEVRVICNYNEGGCGGSTAAGDGEEGAAKAWNTCATPQPALASVAEVDKTMDDIQAAYRRGLHQSKDHAWENVREVIAALSATPKQPPSVPECGVEETTG